MKILSINAGSSSLKFTLFEMPEEKMLISGTFEKIGLNNPFYTIKLNGEKTKKDADLPSHKEAFALLMKELKDNKIIKSYDEIEGIGHRVAQGGSYFEKSELATEENIKLVEELGKIAPLHNPPAVVGINAAKEVVPNATNVLVFDTSFHQTMKDEEYLYAVPMDWYEKFSVRKYGFHGTSHKYIAEKMREMLGEDKKIICCHLGNGASLCAIRDGKCIDTSMGFTPLAGFIMGSRCGDIDPSIIPYVMDKTGLTAEEVITKLNKESGMLALSGISSDMRDVEEAFNNNDPRSVRAMNMYSKRVADYLSMYNTELEGADYIVFTAGIGENDNTTRDMIIRRFNYMGVKLDEEKNNTRGISGIISTEDSTITVIVLPTNEEIMIAKDTYSIINNK